MKNNIATSQQNLPDEDFLHAMQDVKPLPENDKVTSVKGSAGTTLAQQLKRQALEKQQQQDLNYLRSEIVDRVQPDDFLSFKQPGVQDGVFKNLRLGKYTIDSTLNIQRHSLEQARHAVFQSIIQAQKAGIRTLLIQHGMGQHSKPFPAFLKSYVYHWLQQMPEILAFHSAQRQHGGLGCTYVLLKKGQLQKLANRELNRKK